jgi:UMF1 family MFS transporter
MLTLEEIMTGNVESDASVGDSPIASKSEIAKKLMEEMSDEQKKGLQGWYWYDWANQAFALTILTVVAPALTASLFNTATGGGKEIIGLNVTGDSYYALILAVSSLFVAFSSPVLGVIADRMPIKKKLLWAYTMVGIVFTILMGAAPFMGDSAYLWLAVFIVIGNIGFAGGNVIYYAFMPYLADRRCMDRVSSMGYAYGFMGGSLLLLIHLAVLIGPLPESISTDMKLSFVFVTSGLWWLGWGVPMFRNCPEPEISDPMEYEGAIPAAKMAFKEIAKTFREIKKFRVLALYLVAYLLFYDGVNTIAAMASAFGESVLRINPSMNIVLLLTVNVVAIPMSIFGGNLAEKYGTKMVLGTVLMIYCAVAVIAVGFAPLELEDDHKRYDFQYDWNEDDGVYDLTSLYGKTTCCTANSWVSLAGQGDASFRDSYFSYIADTSADSVAKGDDVQRQNISALQAATLSATMSDMTEHRFSFSFSDGPEDGKRSVGDGHPTIIEGGPLDFWPNFMRNTVWKPLGLGVSLQWIFLGMMVGLVMGTAGAQARSMFSMLIPKSRTTEFFGFFGFIGKAAAVIGPLLYAASVAVADSRVAIMSVVVMILGGTYLFSLVDLEEGIRAADEEDRRNEENDKSRTPDSKN